LVWRARGHKVMIKDAASTPTRLCIFEPHAFNAHAMVAPFFIQGE